MPTHVELYEALKPHVGPEAAQLMAEVIPPAGELATKSDIAVLRSGFERLEAATKTDIAGLRVEISQLEARLSQKLLSYFIPLWLMMGSMALAIVGFVAARA